jgi:hypothetical protein
LGSVKFFGKLSVILLIFFSIQGKVVIRYITFFNGRQKQAIEIQKRTSELMQKVTLQCFVEKFQQIDLPSAPIFEFSDFIYPEFKVKYFIFDASFPHPHDRELSFLRGPPTIS